MPNQMIPWEQAQLEFQALWIRSLRLLGMESSMNVWRKQFTSAGPWSFFHMEAASDKEFFEDDSWPKIGSTVTIKKPPRFTENPHI